MDSALLTVALPVALAVIMFGLGLSLTLADFRRVAQHPKAVAVALVVQVILLPVVAFILIKLFGLTAGLAVGIGMQVDKLVQVFAIVLIPVAIGMVVRSRWPQFAARMDKPVRIASAVLLALVVIGAILGERENILDYIVQVGAITTLFCILSLGIGYAVPRLLGLSEPQAIASSFEIGIHNSTSPSRWPSPSCSPRRWPSRERSTASSCSSSPRPSGSSSSAAAAPVTRKTSRPPSTERDQPTGLPDTSPATSRWFSCAAGRQGPS